MAHAPESVLYVDALMGLASALLVGYDLGITGRRDVLSEALRIISIAMTINTGAIKECTPQGVFNGKSRAECLVK